MATKAAAKQAANVKAAVAILTDNRTIGAMTDKLIELREAKRELEAKITVIEAESEEVTQALIAKLDAEGTDRGAGKLGTVSVTSSIVANVTDWEKFYAFIKKTGYFHLLQRRPADAAFRELLETKGVVPGVEPFSKRRLNLRTA